MTDTIYALSSGGLPSGVAVIRISGPKSRVVVETMCDGREFGKAVGLSKITSPNFKGVIDKGLVLTFVAPNSFTGEDSVEFQVHGGRAVVDTIFAALAAIDGFRHAEPGEFTYRAFENGKLDLTQVEGIADLIASETEAQRKLAFDNADGKARKMIEGWSDRLLTMRALIEAEIDFVDESDIPGSVSDQVWADVDRLILELSAHLSSAHAGEIIRNGFRVTLLGKPNAGKSTLLNCLAGRDVAIVTDEPGTTRDVLEVKLNLGGQVVIISDTAGIHDARNKIEREGIRRAMKAADEADMAIWLHAADDLTEMPVHNRNTVLTILSKSEIAKKDKKYAPEEKYDLTISVLNDQGIDRLVGKISEAAKKSTASGEGILFSRERQRTGLLLARDALVKARDGVTDPLEIRAENLRIAADALGRIVGKVDVEDILAAIFSEFCVGK